MISRGSGSFEATVVDADGNEVDVLVKYQGYSDPGRISGPIDRCFAPESEMEIEVIVNEQNVTAAIPESEHERLEELAYERMAADDAAAREDYERGRRER